MAKKRNKLVINKFYIAYGGNAHPALIFEKTKYGTYKAIKTGTTEGKEMIRINPTQKGMQNSFVNRRPFEGTRRDFGNRELIGISFDSRDMRIIEEIKKRKPKISKSAKLAHKKMPSSD